MRRSNHPFLNAAVSAARQAGEYLIRQEGKIKQVLRKDHLEFFNPATNVDVEAEEIIINTLQSFYPEHNFLAEERGEKIIDANSPYLWIIDPLDGTNNYRFRFPFYSVSIALYNKQTQQTEVGVVYAPQLSDLYTAVHNVGVECNDKRIRVNYPSSLSHSMLIISGRQKYKVLDSLARKYQPHLVTTEACSLDMSHIASGKGDAFLLLEDYGVEAWDVAASALILREAGGCVLDHKGAEFDIFSKKPFLSGSRDLVNELVKEFN